MNDGFDILINGGGMVGASLACALGEQGWRIGVIEAHPPNKGRQPSFDNRAIALAQASKRILDGLGVWERIRGQAAPIRHIHVSDRGRFGAARIHAHEEGVEALGYVAENRVIGEALMARMDRLANCEVIAPARLTGFETDEDRVTVDVEADGASRRLQARLLVGADGARSRVRELAGFPVTDRDYGQTAILTTVRVSRVREATAFERFTPTGPLALLPLPGDRYAVVWTALSHEAEDIMGLDGAAFRDRLQARFGFRLGRILEVGRRSAYPLHLVQLERFVDRRLAVIGNAAHTLHPVAGQGFNLCLRDVALMAEHLADQAQAGGDPGDAEWLAAYQSQRSRDYRDVIRLTDGLVRLFSGDGSVVGHLRGAGLLAMDLAPSLRHHLARQSMGLRARPLPGLALGP